MPATIRRTSNPPPGNPPLCHEVPKHQKCAKTPDANLAPNTHPSNTRTGTTTRYPDRTLRSTTAYANFVT